MDQGENEEPKQEHQENQENKTVQYGPTAVVAGDTSGPVKTGLKSRFSFFKKKPVTLALAAVLVFAGIAGYTLTRGESEEPVTTSNTTVSRLGVTPTLIDGTATYKSGSSEWQPLTTETSLSEGDFISTDAGGRVVLTFDDGSAFRLDGSTIIQLVSLVSDDIRIDHTAGTAYSRVVASEREFTVTVADTNYTALGTAFSTVNSDTNKGVQVLQSSVKSSGTDDTIAEGKQYFKEHQNAELKDKITDVNLDELKSSGFMLWNLEQDEKSDLFKDKLGVLSKIKTVEEETPPPSVSGIKLSAYNNDKGTVLSWTVSGVNAPDGFKVVRSKKSSTPTFGKDEAQYISDTKARSFTWKSSTEGTYWYRVCAYRKAAGTCDSYSNSVQKVAVYVAPEKVTRGTMTLTEDSGLLSWNYTGKAIYGYKVVISTDANPTYPEDSYVYYGSASSYALDLSGKPDGTYHVRVCAYTNGSEAEKCVDYSNEVTITKP